MTPKGISLFLDSEVSLWILGSWPKGISLFLDSEVATPPNESPAP